MGKTPLDCLAKYPGKFHLVLMDVQMPIMDGLEATRLIRQNPALKDLPIVAMTTNVYESDRQDCLRASMTDYLAKPLDRAALQALVWRYQVVLIHPMPPPRP